MRYDIPIVKMTKNSLLMLDEESIRFIIKETWDDILWEIFT